MISLLLVILSNSLDGSYLISKGHLLFLVTQYAPPYVYLRILTPQTFFIMWMCCQK